jgi:hypothetical protein
MATSKRCSASCKEPGPMYCTGCDKYFCRKHFKIHSEEMFAEMDKIIEERNHLQNEINIEIQDNNQQNPLIEQIDQWQKRTIEKVKQVAAQARQQASELLNAKRVRLNTEFKSFSQELAHLKESENYVEHDLTRLNQMINKFKLDLKQSTQPTTVVLHTEQSDNINWESLIYVEEKAASTNKQWEASVISKLMSYIFWANILIRIFSSNNSSD